jgi:hypothetical protein
MEIVLTLLGLCVLLMLAGGIGMVKASARLHGPDRPVPDSVGPRDMASFKRMLLAREWRRVLPSLLMIAGLLGFMVLGAIALILWLENPATGWLMLVVPIYAAWRIAQDFRRA